MPKIFDCFTFFNEVDVAHIRFEELYPVVDHFVIVQARQTFRGKPHTPLLDDNPEPIYPSFELDPKYIVVTLDELPGDTPWQREVYQRNYIAEVLKGLAQPDDTIIISDVDEIPRRSMVVPVSRPTRLRLKKFSYGINMLTDEGNTSVVMTPYEDLTYRTPEEMRRNGISEIMDDAGWEFSSLGTPEEILVKLKSFSHSEFDTPDLTVEVLRERMAKGQDIVGREFYHSIVPVDDTWPEAIKNNREYWRKYEW